MDSGCDQMARAGADEYLVMGGCDGLAARFAQNLVTSVGDIVQGVEQSAVKIKNGRFIRTFFQGFYLLIADQLCSRSLAGQPADGSQGIQDAQDDRLVGGVKGQGVAAQESKGPGDSQ